MLDAVGLATACDTLAWYRQSCGVRSVWPVTAASALLLARPRGKVRDALRMEPGISLASRAARARVPNMPKERLRATLSELRRELTTGPVVDDEARGLLQEVAADIDGLLHANELPAASHVGTLTELARRFERDHPRLASAIQQLADALSRVGL